MAIDTTLEQIESLYIGYFGRAGEPDGTNYWVGRLESGYTLAEAAASFSVQAEAINEYPYLAHPELVNPGSFVDDVYQNLFNRAPDAEGRAYWVDQLEARSGDPAAVGQFILDVISGAYGPEGSPADQATLENKVEAASYFTAELAEAGIGGTHVEDGHDVLDANLVGPAHGAVSGVTNDPATVDASEAATDAFIAGGGGNIGDTFTLTTGTDFADDAGSVRNNGTLPSDFKFTSNSEAVIATGATLNIGADGPDSLSDPSTTDNDILTLSLSGATPAGAAFVSNIETINVDATNYNGGPIDLTNVSGARTIDLDGSLSAALTFTDLAGSGATTVDGSGLTSQTNGFTASFFGASGTVARTLTGSDAGDGLVGGNGNDTIQGRGGNDFIDGGTGNDTLDGGVGDDTIIGGTGDDTLNGGDGIDTLIAGDGNDIVNGGAGNDGIDGGNGNDNIDGGAGIDNILAGAGNDIILGGDGNDAINTGTGDNTVTGGAGDDAITLDLGVGEDTVIFGATALDNGNDAIANFLAGNTGDIIDFSAFLGGASTLSTSVATAAGLNATDFNVVRVNDVTINSAATLQAEIGDDADQLNLAVSSNTVALVENGANVDAYYVSTDALGNATTVNLVGTFAGVDVDILTQHNVA
jgi:Ca2+-binding RTX toxin-like protein